MTLIDKERISQLTFEDTDVLVCENEKMQREYMAQKATVLGNLEKQKVEIRFKAKEGSYKVNTTVWCVDKDYIVLKSSASLPLRSITSISL